MTGLDPWGSGDLASAALADFHGILACRQEFGDDLDEVIRVFVERLPERVANIARAVRRCQGAPLAAAAHTLRGSALNLGATHLANCCDRLEQIGKSDHWPEGEAVLARCQGLVDRLGDRLITYPFSSAPPPDNGAPP